MLHEHYVGGAVLIPQTEKVKYTTPRGQQERYENVWTPYIQVGTRIAYFRRLAEVRGLIPVIEAAEVPRSSNPASGYFNGHMPAGYWYLIVPTSGEAVRYLCCTMKVALYEPVAYAERLKGGQPLPVISGESTKQVAGGPDLNGLAKAQTGAIGRALGVAGILTLGTGVATAEDMLEIAGPMGTSPVGPDAAVLPPPVEAAAGEPVAIDPAVAREEMMARALGLQAQMQEEAPGRWSEFVAWWGEQRALRGWAKLGDVPTDALKGIVIRMERALAEGALPVEGVNTETGVAQ